MCVCVYLECFDGHLLLLVQRQVGPVLQLVPAADHLHHTRTHVVRCYAPLPDRTAHTDTCTHMPALLSSQPQRCSLEYSAAQGKVYLETEGGAMGCVYRLYLEAVSS